MQTIQTKTRARGEEGFTLIELLIVIAILGILAGVVVFAVGGTTESAKKNSCKIDRQTIETAAEAFKADNGVYPPTLADLFDKNANIGIPPAATAVEQYLKKAPDEVKDWAYTLATGSVLAKAGGKYDTQIAACNA